MKKGFTLVELLVVIGMIAVIMGALTTSVASAQNRARTQKAVNDVNMIAQAILSYENYQSGELDSIKSMTDQPADSSSIGFLLGDGTSKITSQKIPTLLMASLQNGGTMNDPWGHPYKVTIKKMSATVKMNVASSEMKTGYYLPNVYRIQKDERLLTSDSSGSN